MLLRGKKNMTIPVMTKIRRSAISENPNGRITKVSAPRKTTAKKGPARESDIEPKGRRPSIGSSLDDLSLRASPPTLCNPRRELRYTHRKDPKQNPVKMLDTISDRSPRPGFPPPLTVGEAPGMA